MWRGLNNTGITLMLFFACFSGRMLAAAPVVSATATLAVSGVPAGASDTGTISVSFNGFLEMVNYGPYSTPASLASAFGAMFSRDYIRFGLYAKAGVNPSAPNVIPFQLTNGQTFTSIDYTLSSTSFGMTPSGFGSASSVLADTGTVTLQLAGSTIATTRYADGATPTSVAQELASAVTSSLVTVKAEGNLLYLSAKQAGGATNYPYTISISHDTADFPNPSFQIYPLSGALTGGADQNAQSTPVSVYGYNTNVSGGSGYDATGNLTTLNDQVMGNWTYGYDSLNRLSSSTAQTGPYASQSMCWSYDSFGNRTNQATSNQPFTNTLGLPCQAHSGASYQGSPVTYAAADNHMTTTPQLPSGLAGSSTTWPGNGIYDSGGNIQNDGVNSYLYDAEGRMCAVHGTFGMVGYQYGADGLRVGKGTITSMSCDVTTNGYRATNDYVLDQGGSQVAELVVDENGTEVPQHTNVMADGVLIGAYDLAGLHFYVTDPLGTRRAQTDSAGVPEQTCLGLPFGDSLNCSMSLTGPTENHFTGLERDQESGLDHADHRLYASNAGRWMSPDPYDGSMDLGNPQSLNRYAYVGNNPLSFTDPTGLFILPPPSIDPISIALDGLIAAVDIGEFLSGFFAHPQLTASTVARPQVRTCLTHCGQADPTQAESALSKLSNQPWVYNSLYNTGTFSAGAGDVLSLGATRYINRLDGGDSSIGYNSGVYTAGKVTGYTLGVLDLAAGGATGAALADGKTGTYFGRGTETVFNGRPGGAFIRFGWGWNQALGPAGRDIIRLGIGAARGTSWYSHFTFWIIR